MRKVCDHDDNDGQSSIYSLPKNNVDIDRPVLVHIFILVSSLGRLRTMRIEEVLVGTFGRAYREGYV